MVHQYIMEDLMVPLDQGIITTIGQAAEAEQLKLAELAENKAVVTEVMDLFQI